jgi:hypothetical protein
MKKLATFLFFLFAINAYAQKKAVVSQIKNESLVNLLSSVDTVYFKESKEIRVVLYQVDNESGSAGIAGSEEVSTKFLIAVSEFGELPDQSLFSVGDFYNPKIIKFSSLKNNDCLLQIEYGAYKSRKKITLNISLNKVIVPSGK